MHQVSKLRRLMAAEGALMATPKVTAHLVNGCLLDFDVDPDFLERLRTLETQGLAGRSLIHALLTDDWGAPPVFLRIVGAGSNGYVDITIPYE